MPVAVMQVRPMGVGMGKCLMSMGVTVWLRHDDTRIMRVLMMFIMAVAVRVVVTVMGVIMTM